MNQMLHVNSRAEGMLPLSSGVLAVLAPDGSRFLISAPSNAIGYRVEGDTVHWYVESKGYPWPERWGQL